MNKFKFIQKLDIINFKEKYIVNNFNNIFFKNLEEILSLDKSIVNKQRRIEKLTNIYLLKKDENKYEMNPLWSNKINNIFYY